MILPPEARRAQGDAAEERACRHLDRSGFTIVERNYRTKGGEIDIVARKGDVLVFVEVRSLEVPDFGIPRRRCTGRSSLHGRRGRAAVPFGGAAWIPGARPGSM